MRLLLNRDEIICIFFGPIGSWVEQSPPPDQTDQNKHHRDLYQVIDRSGQSVERSSIISDLLLYQ